MPALDVQACRDRSGEFSAVLRALRERQQAAAPGPAAAAAARPAALGRHKEFMAVANTDRPRHRTDVLEAGEADAL